jgi:predicted RNA-binding protein
MRKEIQKSLKEEIDLRRKVDIEDEIDLEKSIDIRGLAEKVQNFQDKRNELRKKTIVKAQEETDRIASEIVTIQEAK